ncbi:hypothetical protein IQ260_06445 [Leptolyngbya cf. ectocarpi LEGE 11479]|uniref:Uncharacterized protein n=1 Tax=Leptolyngbya cf. ectocarpi LEGE 11479 TaxID=1828722 RepID=A0A928X3B2_LEPEC|nr:hypothetical protein [Leptolyngbya ectocarpi]MBE9066288.1 hypothetical protein [Leptolyngbya cf. ectocarpi LEGE 11479]
MKLTQWSVIPVLYILLSGHDALAQSLREQVNAVSQINEQQLITDIPATASAAAPSDQEFTVPSLWWQQHQQGEAIDRRLIDNWYAYSDQVSPIPHVDVVVNGQIWPLLNYLEQYAFITQFGESAKSDDYQLRVFTGNRLVGLHVCDFRAERSSTGSNENTAEPCVVELDYFGQGAIRGRSR